jgi:hypothetical protein
LTGHCVAGVDKVIVGEGAVNAFDVENAATSWRTQESWSSSRQAPLPTDRFVTKIEWSAVKLFIST